MRLIAPEAPILSLTPIEAELAKLSANAMLAAKIAVANDLALVCGRFDVPWSRVQAAVGLDRRIGLDHLSVSKERGFGGACLPKDLDGLVVASRSAGYEGLSPTDGCRLQFERDPYSPVPGSVTQRRASSSRPANQRSVKAAQTVGASGGTRSEVAAATRDGWT